MKKLYFILACLSFIPHSYSQTCADYVVQLSAQVQVSPPQITLSWPSVSGANGFNVFKKTKGSSSWGAAIASLPNTATSYIDNNVMADSAYEYTVQAPNNPAFGYIYAGINAPAIHNRGTLLLLVDSTFTDSCSAEISQLMKDISADGWRVLRRDFLRATSHISVKNYISTSYSSSPDVKAVLILGHIAVPYSGDFDSSSSGLLAPDGHKDHAGAWPADSYYGEMTSTWTDLVNNQKGTRAANKNAPGDGKWDQTQLPSALELQVSRIDFANMPAFPKSEVQMMKTYLAKDHQYKTAALAVNHRTLIDDNFGKFNGEGFAAAAYRLAPLVGNTNIQNLDLVTTLNTSSYQWALGCGAGSFTTCSGVGASADFSTNNVNAIFTMFFGSYFGDWNVQNNFLRAPLCSNNPALTSCWSGRPHWYFHHMALGENIGYAAITSQNNTNTYTNPVNIYPTFIHPALMGDLTLRTDYMLQPSAVTLTSVPGGGAKVTWTASLEPGVIGYYVYRSDEEFGTYQKRSNLLTALSYNDSFGTDGVKYYMVRAVKLQSTPSGSYNNLSLGATSSPVNIDYPYADNTGITRSAAAQSIVSIYPNPATDKININVNSPAAGSARFNIINQQGQILNTKTVDLQNGTNVISIDVAEMPAGLYYIVVTGGNVPGSAKWMKINRQ